MAYDTSVASCMCYYKIPLTYCFFLCLCRPLPPDEMKNIIFSVFGEDMSTGVVTQVNSVCSHKYAIAYRSFFWGGRITCNEMIEFIADEQTSPQS